MTTRGGAAPGFQKWVNNIVPYQFDPSFTPVDRQTFLAAAAQVSAASCVSFVEGSASQSLYVTRDCPCGGNCFSGGYTDGLGAASPRRLVIGSPCLSPNSQSSVGFVAHEILHALGIVHTQTRPDRDSHVTVNVGNISPPGAANQFSLCSSCNTFNTAYDCRSIMHYRAFFFSQGCSPAQPQSCSMTALTSSCDLFASASVLTESDKQLINRIYDCEDTTSAPTPPPPTTTPPPPPTPTCMESCGGRSPAGCWCDTACVNFGDCCPDHSTVCLPATTTTTPTTTTTTTTATTTTEAPSLTCKNNCGFGVSLNGQTCYCDFFCVYFGDCCSDRDQYCTDAGKKRQSCVHDGKLCTGKNLYSKSLNQTSMTVQGCRV